MPQVSHHRALEIDLLEASLRSQHEYIASLDADHEDHGDLRRDSAEDLFGRVDVDPFLGDFVVLSEGGLSHSEARFCLTQLVFVGRAEWLLPVVSPA